MINQRFPYRIVFSRRDKLEPGETSLLISSGNQSVFKSIGEKVLCEQVACHADHAFDLAGCKRHFTIIVLYQIREISPVVEMTVQNFL